MLKAKKASLTLLFALALFVSKPTRADLFGNDVIVLTQILINAVQQLVQLKQILSTESDTLGLLREVNNGVRDGLLVLQVIKPDFAPGLYGDLLNVDSVMSVLRDVYGIIPPTPEAKLQTVQDQSVAESISMNGALFKYADQTDAESRRIFSHAQVVNPNGAGKLTAQSIAVLIGVTSQVLRTNSMMLKMMGQNMALQNHKEKIQSAQFKTQYEGLSSAFSTLPKATKLTPLLGGH